MYIFYDFETSTRDFLGQILSYAFVVTTVDFQPRAELIGRVKLNPTQLPETQALLTNRIAILDHQSHPESLSEYDTARRIHAFLAEQIDRYGECTLVGFNSNQFDLNFLRNLLIRYGLNPYFFGKLKNKDVLHFVQAIAFAHPEAFPWVLSENEQGHHYYIFTLESLLRRFELADNQDHDAKSDVMLTMALVRYLENAWGMRLKDFVPMHLGLRRDLARPMGRTWQLDFPAAPGQRPVPRKAQYWASIFESDKGHVMLDLQAYGRDPAQPLNALRYKNPNKHFFRLEPPTLEEVAEFELILEQSKSDPFLASLTLADYFELIQKDWDIDYQSHAMGFQHIDMLADYIARLMANPAGYSDCIAGMLALPKTPKRQYMIQLFNRAYLNYHPAPLLGHAHRYLVPRYVTGEMLRSPDDFVPLSDRVADLKARLAMTPSDHPDHVILSQLEGYFSDFIKRYGLPGV